MSLLLLFNQSSPTVTPAVDFQLTLDFSAQGGAFAVGLNSRESIEALETYDASAINSRESIEVLYNTEIDGLNSRESIETLWQQTNDTALNARLSIEILEGPILNKQSWGFIPVT